MFGERRMSSYMLLHPQEDQKNGVKKSASPPPLPKKQSVGKKMKGEDSVMASNKRRYSQMMQESKLENENVKDNVHEILQKELHDLRQELKNEKNRVKNLERKNSKIERTVKEQEERFRLNSIQELQNRFQHEKEQLVAITKEQLKQKHQVELNKIVRKKDDEIRKIKEEQNDLHSQIRTLESSTTSISSPRDSGNWSHDLEILKEHKKQLENMIKVVLESEKSKDEELKIKEEMYKKQSSSITRRAKTEVSKLKRD